MKRDRMLAAGLVLATSVSRVIAGEGVVGPAGDPTPTPQRAVVVELFTSQGCSSCPPADRLLSDLGRRGSETLVPLAYHVDFWNHIGWADPFSSAEWTKRQESYARRLGVDGLYTPQAVVDGSVELVGSDAAALESAIAAASSRPAASIALRLEPRPSAVFVEAAVEIPRSLRDRTWDLMLAVYETGLSTAVGRGENGGRTLRNDYVVRSLRRASRVKDSSRVSAELNLGRGWNPAHLGVAAFLQDPNTLEIRGAGARLIPAP